MGTLWMLTVDGELFQYFGADKAACQFAFEFWSRSIPNIKMEIFG